MIHDTGFELKVVRDRATLKEFVRVPGSLYANDPHYVKPLTFERLQALGSANPFFAHAEWQAWVAYRNGEPVGRISAQIDELALQHRDPHTGHFGMFEAPDEPLLAGALFAAAERWLRERNMRRVEGPFNLSINQELGLQVGGFDTRPFFMMPHGRPYYEALVRDQGYEPTQDLLAMSLDPGYPNPPIMEKILKRFANRIRVRPINRRRLTSELDCMRDIFNDAWSGNWGFVPFTQAEFRALGRELVLIVPRDMVQIAEVDGVPAAFGVTMPNLNECLADLDGRLLPFGWARLLWRLKVRFTKTARSPLMGVRSQYQKKPLGLALALAIMEVARQKASAHKIEELELSWILEANEDMWNLGTLLGGTETRRYRMYGKSLT